MALQKAITIADAGITPEYWRVGGVYIDATTGNARIVLVGYASAQIRANNGRHVDQREYVLAPVQFNAYAQSKSLPVSESDQAEIEAHIQSAPAAVADFLQRALALTTYSAIAAPCYQYIKEARRLCIVDPDTGEAIAETGERFPADQIVMIGEQPTVPSEFADAVDA